MGFNKTWALPETPSSLRKAFVLLTLMSDLSPGLAGSVLEMSPLPGWSFFAVPAGSVLCLDSEHPRPTCNTAMDPKPHGQLMELILP